MKPIITFLLLILCVLIIASCACETDPNIETTEATISDDRESLNLIDLPIPDFEHSYYISSVSIGTIDALDWFTHIADGSAYQYMLIEDAAYALSISSADGWSCDGTTFISPDGRTVAGLSSSWNYYVPKSSFSQKTLDTGDFDATWLNENVLRLTSERPYMEGNQEKIRREIMYLIAADLGDEAHDCVISMLLDTMYYADEVSVADELVGSLVFSRCMKKLVTIDKTTIYQRNYDTLVVVASGAEPWVIDGYHSDGGFEAAFENGILEDLNVRVYECPNTYEITLDPQTRTITDTHLSEDEIVRKLGVEDGYISCRYDQTADGRVRATFLYDDRLLVINETQTYPPNCDIALLCGDEPVGETRKNFLEMAKAAAAYGYAPSKSNHWTIHKTGVTYYLNVDSACYTYDSFRQYLSCIFTNDSVEYILTRKYINDMPCVIKNDNGMLYVLSDLVNPDIDKMTLVCEDGYWKWDYSE